MIQAGLSHRNAAKVVAGVLFLIIAVAVFLLLSAAATRAAGWKAATARYIEGGLDFVAKTEKLLTDQVPWLRRSPLLRAQVRNLDDAGDQFAEKYLGVVLVQLVHWLPSLLLVPYLNYFLLNEGNRFRKHLIRSVPNAFFEKTLLLVDRVDRSLQSYFLGLMKLTLLDTVCLALGLWLLGVSYPMLLGLVAAVMSWVPYIGSAAGCVLVVVVAATDFPNVPLITYSCIALFLGVRLLDDFVFMPMTIGRSLSLHPVLSVVMLFLGAAVAGPAGLLLVLPITGVVAVITETLVQILTDPKLRSRYRHARQLSLRWVDGD